MFSYNYKNYYFFNNIFYNVSFNFTIKYEIFFWKTTNKKINYYHCINKILLKNYSNQKNGSGGIKSIGDCCDLKNFNYRNKIS